MKQNRKELKRELTELVRLYDQISYNYTLVLSSLGCCGEKVYMKCCVWCVNREEKGQTSKTGGKLGIYVGDSDEVREGKE